MSFGATVGVMLFEIVIWAVFLTLIIYVVFKLYNGIISSLPFS